MISRCYFAEDGWEMYTLWKHTSWAIVLLFRSFFLLLPRCRRRRGLLKVPTISDRHESFFTCGKVRGFEKRKPARSVQWVKVSLLVPLRSPAPISQVNLSPTRLKSFRRRKTHVLQGSSLGPACNLVPESYNTRSLRFSFMLLKVP